MRSLCLWFAALAAAACTPEETELSNPIVPYSSPAAGSTTSGPDAPVTGDAGVGTVDDGGIATGDGGTFGGIDGGTVGPGADGGTFGGIDGGTVGPGTDAGTFGGASPGSAGARSDAERVEQVEDGGF